jgi:hypothetical protein
MDINQALAIAQTRGGEGSSDFVPDLLDTF